MPEPRNSTEIRVSSRKPVRRSTTYASTHSLRLGAKRSFTIRRKPNSRPASARTGIRPFPITGGSQTASRALAPDNSSISTRTGTAMIAVSAVKRVISLPLGDTNGTPAGSES